MIEFSSNQLCNYFNIYVFSVATRDLGKTFNYSNSYSFYTFNYETGTVFLSTQHDINQLNNI